MRKPFILLDGHDSTYNIIYRYCNYYSIHYRSSVLADSLLIRYLTTIICQKILNALKSLNCYYDWTTITLVIIWIINDIDNKNIDK